MKRTSKFGKQALGVVKSGAVRTGGVVTGVSFALDAIQVGNEQISGQRFGYRTAVNVAAITIGTFLSAGLGAVVAGVGFVGEKAYDYYQNTILPSMTSHMIGSGSSISVPFGR